MPNIPEPYLMRDWKEVAIGYDSIVYNYNANGDYLPVLFFRNNSINYPNKSSFGIHTYVGTKNPTSGEAINVIPSVISASLVGIDKSNQYGYNWVEMCREYFNKFTNENVYLNHPAAKSGSDWWYDTMPNIFFFQLYDMYPKTNEFYIQLVSVAAQWLRAINQMGGKTTPWRIPFMNYRAWDLINMTPNSSGVNEPEASGAIAWILYSAYIETKDDKYRVGAELSLEYLNSYSGNPSYELQLPYGVSIASRMNAELGTNYDIEKMLNWCFEVGELRNWGAIIGKWERYDISGLIGEVNGQNDYAFLMNTIEHVGALVPLVRYDNRFANAIGKWVLNAVNASRLFYRKYLPDGNQDSEVWSRYYDPNSYIGYEAIRENKYSQSPYATGDAIDGSWSNTNLALYASSHVGILGGIIDTTNIKGILKLDLLKTDYFNYQSYPSYLIYNPHSETKDIEINIGNENKNIYEAIDNRFILNNVSGITNISIPASSSLIIVLTPPSGNLVYDKNKLVINDVIVDYSNDKIITNYAPRIKSLSATNKTLMINDSTNVYCTAFDKDNDNLIYNWSSSFGEIIGDSSMITWIAPNEPGEYIIMVEIDDNENHKVYEEIAIMVKTEINYPLKIVDIKADQRKIDIGSETKIHCITSLTSSDKNFEWTSTAGNIIGRDSVIVWEAPNIQGNYVIICTISDENGMQDVDSIVIAVRDLSIIYDGNNVLHLPFNNNINDVSTYNNIIINNGAMLTTNRKDEYDKAFQFNGNSSNIIVRNNSHLNFTNAISINLWININKFYDREQYPISHGNWEKRWKVSITNNKIRWTINTSTGIADLDSETLLQTNMWYNISLLFNGSDMEIYINGRLDAFKNWTGKLNLSNVDLTIGQAIPSNQSYNFNGKLDDIKIYDYPISLETIISYYDISTTTNNPNSSYTNNYLFNNYPNPFNGMTNITFTLNEKSLVKVNVYNILGERVKNITKKYYSEGQHQINWNGRDKKNLGLNSGIYFIRLETDSYSKTIKAVMLN